MRRAKYETSNLYNDDYLATRARLYARTGGECERCGECTQEWQSHHLHYQGHEDLVCLCPSCHYAADRIRQLDYRTLEKSAAANWPILKEWMERTHRRGWHTYGEWELVVIFYQRFLIMETSCTVWDVIQGIQIKSEYPRETTRLYQGSYPPEGRMTHAQSRNP